MISSVRLLSGLIVLVLIMTSNSFVVMSNDLNAPPAPLSPLAAIDAYAVNRDAFQFFSCSFKVTEGESRNLEDARKGVFHSTKPALSGKWIVKGAWERYQVRPESKELDRLRSGDNSTYRSPYINNMLTDGRFFIRYGEVSGLANLSLPPESDLQRMRPVETPFPQMNYYLHSVDYYRKNPNLLSPLVTRKVNNHTLIHMTATTIYENNVREPNELSFDADAGYLIVELTVPTSKISTYSIHHYLTDTFSFPTENRWFPKKWTRVFWHPDKQQALTTVIEVTHLETTVPPADSEFDLQLDNCFQLLDPQNPSTTLTPPPKTVVKVNDMQRIADMLQNKAHQRSVLEAAFHPSAPPSRTSKYMWRLLVGGLLCFIVAVIYIRVRRRKNPTPNTTTPN